MPWNDTRRSIRHTLLLMLLPAAFVLMTAAWLIHGTLLDRMANSFVEQRLQEEVAFLEHQLRNTGRQGARELAEDNYFEEVFHHVFAIRIGSDDFIAPDHWEASLRPLLDSHESGFLREADAAAGTGDYDYLAFRRAMQLGDESVVIIVAEDITELDRSQYEFHLWTAVVSTGFLLLLLLVIWLAIRLSLRSVARLEHALKDLQHGERERIDVDVPREFEPLVAQLNRLLDAMDQRLARSREALANLSHSIKTPIAAVRQVLDDEHRALDRDLRSQMAQRLSAIDRQLEAEMRRGQFAGPQAGQQARPAAQARELIWMLGRLYPDMHFELSTALDEERHWPMEAQDLNEILGNLLDNAGKWARRDVTLSLAEQDGQMRIIVRDDGPGVAPDVLPTLGTRGVRLDEQAPGHGLGLSIVRELTERYGGRLQFSNADEGGLSVHVFIPRG